MLKRRTASAHTLWQHIASGPSMGTCPAVEEFLGGVDSRALWLQLALTPAQAARLTGIPARRISRWMERGWLLPSSHNLRLCSGQTVEEAILLDRALARGFEPIHAVGLVWVQRLRRHQLQQLQSGQGGVRTTSQAGTPPCMTQEFAEAALRMLLLDVLEGAPDLPGSRLGQRQGCRDASSQPPADTLMPNVPSALHMWARKPPEFDVRTGERVGAPPPESCDLASTPHEAAQDHLLVCDNSSSAANQ